VQLLCLVGTLALGVICTASHREALGATVTFFQGLGWHTPVTNVLGGTHP
jgi:hypothetical protein